MQITVHNRGPDDGAASSAAAALVSQHLVVEGERRRSPSLTPSANGRSSGRASELGRLLAVLPTARPSCCSATTKRTSRRLFGRERRRGYFKDAFHDYVIHGDSDAVNPERDRHQGGGALSSCTCRPADRVQRPAAA